METEAGDVVLSDYQQRLRDRFLAAPVVSAPPPWRPVLDNKTPIGGLQGIGFAVHPEDGRDLVMVTSMDGHGLFDAVTGEKIARDRHPAPDGPGRGTGMSTGEPERPRLFMALPDRVGDDRPLFH